MILWFSAAGRGLRAAGLVTLVLLTFCGAAPARAQQSAEEQLAAASALFDARKFAESAQRLEAFLAGNPKHAKAGPAALALGRCYSQLKQFPKAIQAYEKAAATKDAAVLPGAELGIAEAAMSIPEYGKAAVALERAVKLSLKPDQGPLAWLWLGQADFELQKFSASEEAYLHVTREFPKSDLLDSAYYGAGLAEVRQNKLDEARQRLRVVVDRYPKSENRPQALLVLAQIDLEAKRYREARTGFEALLRDPAAHAAGDLQKAADQGLVEALLQLKEYPAAASRLEALLARLPASDPERSRAQLSLGHCRYNQKQYDPALRAYEDASRSTDAEVAAEAYYWAGNAALGLNRPADAARDFTTLVTRFPKNPLASKAQLKAGDAYVQAKQNDAAATAYRAVVEKYGDSPSAAEARKALADLVQSVTDPTQLAAALKNAPPAERARGSLRLGRLYLEAKRYAEAQAALTALLREKPEPEVGAEAHYLLGVSYDAQEKPAPAAEALAAAVKEAPNAEWAADAQSRLAWFYLDLKQPANAEKAAAAALAAKPSTTIERQARLAQVQSQLELEKWDAALDGCRALLAGNPPAETVATVVYTQAWIADKQGKSAEAQPLWERITREFPKSEYAAEAYLRIGDARLAAEKYEEARQQYTALINGYPNSPRIAEARFKLGSALYNQDKAPDAAAEWDRVAAVKTAGDYLPESLYWAGVAYDKLGRKEEAIQRLSRLVTQFPKHERVAKAKIRLAALKAVSAK